MTVTARTDAPALAEVEVRPLAPTRLERLIGEVRTEEFRRVAEATRDALDGRTVLNVNSTATGGGVAELLQTLLAYARGVGVDTRWNVIRGNPRFFEITKRIHNHLYGTSGDGGPLGAAERHDYEATLAPNADALLARARAGDVVVLHDPQTAGLVPSVKDAGATVVWRCHIGIDRQNEHSERGWDFVRPYVEQADAFVFSRAEFAPQWMERSSVHVIAPSIDPFSAKNQHIPAAFIASTLQRTGLLEGVPANGNGACSFTRRDGSTGRVSCTVDMLGTGAIPCGAPLVLQASRWDAMKDMQGVLVSFARHVDAMEDAHLLLAGPATAGVADDPESQHVLDECLRAWAALEPTVRSRVHLASVPMGDPDEAAAVVNAMQRYARVVTQKSIAEGFGLTVVEAMWKDRAVVASNVGGIADQIVSGESGILVEDATDVDEFAAAVALLLRDPMRAEEMGHKARQRASELFLGDRHLQRWAALVAALRG